MSFNSNTPPNVLTRLRKVWVWTGIGMVVLGLAALFMPVLSSLVIGILIGWLLFLGGIVTVASAFSFRGTDLFAWQLVAGLVPLSAGAFLIVFPAQGVIALTLLVGLLFLLSGIAQAAFALWARLTPGWGWGTASAAVSILLGGYILVALPAASEVLLGILVGIDFLSTGLAMILIARSARPDPGVFDA